MGARGIPRNTNAAQFVTFNGSLNTGLCGQVSLSAIFATADSDITVQDLLNEWDEAFISGKDGRPPQLTWVNENGDNDPLNYTWGREIRDFVNYAYGNSWGIESLVTPWSSWGDNKVNQFYDSIIGWLAAGKYVLAPATIISGSQWVPYGGMIGGSPTKDEGSGHWVVVTGVSREWEKNNTLSPWNWVRIYNPFDNATEYYWSGHFVPPLRFGTMELLTRKPRRLQINSCGGILIPR